jgi:hypothetical protein
VKFPARASTPEFFDAAPVALPKMAICALPMAVLGSLASRFANIMKC